MKTVFPNFKRNILNISATLSDFLGVPNEHAKLKLLQTELSKDYKNIIFICFDGLSTYTMKKNLGKNDFLRKNIKQKLTSTFPSTTTCATTTLRTAMYPSEHGWFSWSLYLKEIDKVVCLFRDHDLYTEQPIDANLVSKILPISAYYNSVPENCPYEINTVFQDYKTINAKKHFTFTTIDEQFEHLSKIAKQNSKQFVYSYNSSPDKEMHLSGLDSRPAREFIKSISRNLQKFTQEHPDTLLVITGDHGHTETKEHINLYEDEELKQYLLCPPYGDARAVSLKAKSGQHRNLLLYICKRYRRKVKIYKTQKLIDRGVFGPVTGRLDMLGAYILVPKPNIFFRISENCKIFVTHHSGLTSKEMYVPLILIGNK